MRKAMLISALGSVFLAACGGGGGTSATLSPFTTFSSIQPGTTVKIDGISQSGTYTYDTVAEEVTARTLGASTTGASYTSTYDSVGNATSVTVTPAGGSAITWSRAAGDTFGELLINSSVDAVISADGTRYALAANPFDLGWNYQSFGIWTTGGGTGSGTYGALSVGSTTPGSAIPASGIATFTGASGGRYVDGAGQDFFTSSLMSATANFGTQNISFSTSGTTVSPDLLSSTTNSNLNMTGTLSYSPATNLITGNVSTLGGLTGTVNARFYGPSAQEIGGTFALEASPSSLEGYAGAFGGAR